MDKTDPLDAYIIADFARCGRITSQPWRGAQFLALQRLSRHRLHLITGIGPVLASGILAEIGTITSFHSHDALAKYAGLTWRVKQSGNYSNDDTKMTKTGNKYLRYYLIEAANGVKNHVPEYKEFYYNKYGVVADYRNTPAYQDAFSATCPQISYIFIPRFNFFISI